MEVGNEVKNMGHQRDRDSGIPGDRLRSRRNGSVARMMVMSLKQLVKEGFSEKDLRAISKSEDFPEVGFRGEKKGSVIYFYPAKLQKYLERRTRCQF